MESYELLRDIFEKHNVKEIAAALNLSLSLVYKWAEPSEDNGSGAVNPLDRIEGLLKSTKDTRLLEWLCSRSGGFYIRNPKSHWCDAKALIPATNQIVQEFADLLSVISIAASDNQVSKQEASNIRARWEELKSVTEGFVRCCEEGNFGRIREAIPKENSPA
jgi:hypothetical protein